MRDLSKQRVAIYARVSTTDKGQNPENQLAELREWCKHSNFNVVSEYVDNESGNKGTKGRDSFREMFDDAAKRKFDIVLVWALDRLTREGMAQTVFYLQRLATYGVGFHSYQEPMLSTQDELSRDILLGVLSALAKAEAKRISVRTKAGLERAKKQGKKLGRPPLPDLKRSLILAESKKGKSLRAIAKDTGVSYASVRRYLMSLPKDEKANCKKEISLGLHLNIENNSKWVRGKKKAKESVDWHLYCHFGEAFRATPKARHDYEIKVSYTDDEELEKIIEETILSEIAQIADDRNCYSDDTYLEALDGSDRTWE